MANESHVRHSQIPDPMEIRWNLFGPRRCRYFVSTYIERLYFSQKYFSRFGNSRLPFLAVERWKQFFRLRISVEWLNFDTSNTFLKNLIFQRTLFKIVRTLEGLRNFAGAEDWEDVAAGVMGFGLTGLGKRIADACLRDLKTNFRGDVWGNNGPGVITRTLQKICATKYVNDIKYSDTFN